MPALQPILETGKVAPVFLARVTAGKHMPFFAADSTAWKVVEADRVVQVFANGDELTLAADSAGVISTAGTWFWDRTYLWVHLAADADPGEPDQNVVAMVRFDLASEDTDLDGVPWTGRLKSLPGASLRIEDEFDSLSQISGGSLVAANNDGFFDSRFGLQWDAGRTQLYFGDKSQAFEDFQLLATLENVAPEKNNTEFTLELEELKGRGKKKIPFTFYTQFEFPAMREQDRGRAKQIGFGTVLGINPVCIDITVPEFRVADHPIKSFDRCRVQDGEGAWSDVNFLAVDEANGIFRLDPADWHDGLEISVDFSGWVDDDGLLMENAADQMKALLIQFGETNLDEASFTTAHNLLDIGYFTLTPWKRVTRRKVSLYIDEGTDLLEVAAKINMVVGSYLTTDEQGRYKYQVFRPQQGKALPVLSDEHILDGSFETFIEEGAGFSKVAAKFAARPAEDVTELAEVSRPLNQYMRNEAAPLVQTLELATVSREDAKRICQRVLTLSQSRKVRYKFKVKWLAFTLRVADQIKVEYQRHGLDQVLEILEWKPNIVDTSMVELTLGNLHGYDDISGFWVESTDETPTGDPLTWSADERKYKRQNAGHWHNGKWFATDTPTDRLDHRTSVWIG